MSKKNNFLEVQEQATATEKVFIGGGRLSANVGRPKKGDLRNYRQVLYFTQAEKELLEQAAIKTLRHTNKLTGKPEILEN
jgi:hypothetical protein